MPFDQPTRRLQKFLWVLLLWTGLIFGRLVWLQLIKHGDYVRLAEQQQERTEEVQGLRGSILDRTGQPLAKTLPVDSIVANPLRIRDEGIAADLLAPVLGLNRNELYNKLKTAKAHNKGFVWIARKVSPEQSASIRGF